MIRLILIDVNSDEYKQGLHYYQFMANLEWCNGSCISTDDPSCRNCVPDKTENINVNVFNMITRINESKTLIKDMSCECKCKFDCSKYNSSLKWNKNKRQYECKSLKKHHVCKKHYIIWNPRKYTCENGKYLESIMGNSVVIYDEIIEVTKKLFQ